MSSPAFWYRQARVSPGSGASFRERCGDCTASSCKNYVQPKVIGIGRLPSFETDGELRSKAAAIVKTRSGRCYPRQHRGRVFSPLSKLRLSPSPPAQGTWCFAIQP
jgi:hypothetical protein